MIKTKAILVPYPVDKAYDYAVPDGMDLNDGDYVTVPLSGREVSGVVWGGGSGHVNPAKIKYVLVKHQLSPMPEVQRKFIDWAAHYTMTPLGFVLKMSLSTPDALDPPAPSKGYCLASKPPPTYILPPMEGRRTKGGGV